MTRSFTAHVRDGVIVADDIALAEGAPVTVFDDADVDGASGELTAAELELVDRGRAELARGEGISRAELMASLRRARAERAAQSDGSAPAPSPR